MPCTVSLSSIVFWDYAHCSGYILHHGDGQTELCARSINKQNASSTPGTGLGHWPRSLLYSGNGEDMDQHITIAKGCFVLFVAISIIGVFCGIGSTVAKLELKNAPDWPWFVAVGGAAGMLITVMCGAFRRNHESKNSQ